MEGKSTASTRAFTAAEKERSKVNSVFMSTTDRFVSMEKNTPAVRILNPERKRKTVDDTSQLERSLMKTTNSTVKAVDKVQYDLKD